MLDYVLDDISYVNMSFFALTIDRTFRVSQCCQQPWKIFRRVWKKFVRKVYWQLRKFDICDAFIHKIKTLLGSNYCSFKSSD
jgi:hypothetical protein